MKIIRFIKNWTLPISMLSGVAAYFIYVNIPLLAPTKPLANKIADIILPVFVFLMLFLSFCNVNPKELRFQRQHIWLLIIQTGTFVLLSVPLIIFRDTKYRILLESAMIGMITPTGTAAAVVTHKLEGNVNSLISYTIIINIFSALVIPVVLSLSNNNPAFTFIHSFIIILVKVFPLLIFPFLLAVIVRRYFPKLHKYLLQTKDLAFYLWAFVLAIAIAITVRSIVHSHVKFIYQFGIAIISLATCVFQFAVGKAIGSKYNDRISGGQSMGQKNTGFSIWLGVTFMTPITSLAGGFYSIWHNVINSYQLYQKRKGKNV